MKTLDQLADQFNGRFVFSRTPGGLYSILDTHKQKRRVLGCDDPAIVVEELERECLCVLQHEGNGK